MSKCKKHNTTLKIIQLLETTQISICQQCQKEKEQKDKEEIELQEKYLKKQKIIEARNYLNLPKRFALSSFENFIADCKETKFNKKICEEYSNDFEKNLACGKSIIMTGQAGNGKTHLAIAIIKAIAENGFKSIYSNSLDIFQNVKNTYSSSENEKAIINKYCFVDLLVIDEIGVGHNSETERAILFQIVNKRYEDLKPTILISNLSRELLKKVAGERIIDRMKDNGGITLKFENQSKRK